MNSIRKWLIRGAATLGVVGAFALLFSTYSDTDRPFGTKDALALPEPEGEELTDSIEALGDGEELAVFEQNGRTLLVSAGGAVRLADAAGSTLWRNTAREEDARLLGTEDAAVSPVTVTYRHDGETDITLYSDTDAVQKGQYTVALSPDGERLRVTYLLGEVGQSGYMPYGLTKSYMEKTLLPQLEEEEQSFLLQRYILCSAEDANGEMLEHCPALAKTSLYYLKNSGSFVIQNRIIALLKKGGMDTQTYEEQCAATGESPATYDEAYLVTTEYWLEDGDLLMNVPADEIRFHASDPLTTVTFNGAATYATQEESGAYLLPAGSGALQRFSEGGERNARYAYFGTDALSTATAAEESTFPLPVYGVLREDAPSMLAVIEEGAACAVLQERASEGACQLTVSLQLMGYGDASVTAKQTSTHFGAVYTGDLTVRYRFFAPGADAAALAAGYRSLLLAQDKLPQTPKNTDTLAVELVGTVDYRYERLGIFPATEALRLTDWSATGTILRTLTDAGLHPITELSGYNRGGLLCQTPGSYRFSSALGSQKEREQVLTLVEKQQLSAFLNVSLATRYGGTGSGSGGYSPQKSSARTVNNAPAALPIAGPSTGEQWEKAGVLQVVRPSLFTTLTAQYGDAIDPRLGLGFGDSLQQLNTDFSDKDPMGRSDTLAALTQSVTAAAAQRRVTGTGALLTTLSTVDYVGELSLRDSGTYSFSAAVPFVQMVLHGHVSYTSTPVNGASDYRTALLEAVATGSLPKYTLIGHYDERLAETAYDSLYYADSDRWLSQIVADGAAVAALYETVGTREITGYTQQGQLIRTAYDGGLAVLVNLGDTPLESDGVTVPAKDWKLVRF